MSITGLLAFTSYIAHIYWRWARVTFRRYGARGVLSPSYRPQHAGAGVGGRRNAFGRAHGNLIGGAAVWSIIDRLERERAAWNGPTMQISR